MGNFTTANKINAPISNRMRFVFFIDGAFCIFEKDLIPGFRAAGNPGRVYWIVKAGFEDESGKLLPVLNVSGTLLPPAETLTYP